MKKNNKKKRNSKIILIVIISIMVLLIGSTLAYLIVTNKGNDKDYITMDNIDIEYVDGSSIRNNDLQIPMNEDEVLKYAPKHEFSVRNNNNKEIYLRFKLTNLNIDKEIYSDSNLRYSLYHNDEKIGVGSFEAYDEKTKELTLLTNIKQNASSEENYQLYIWIRDNGGNQNHFLNINLDGKIKVEGYDKELPTLASAILGKNNKNVITDAVHFDKIAVSQKYYDTLTENTLPHPNKSDAIVENGLYKDTDSDGDTYYYRGYVENNYISFAEILWRILRINGDGTIRIVTDEFIGKSKYNESNTIEKYEGYTYDNSMPNIQDGKSSTIKKYLEDWYNDNLLKYDKYISTSEFCNDTTDGKSRAWFKTYASFDKLFNEYNNSTSYICPETDKTYGGKYYLKIGLPNIDDIKHIGIRRYHINNSLNYNFGIPNTSMTMSPSGNYNNTNNSHIYYTTISIFGINSNGFAEYGNLEDLRTVFPIINLNQNNIVIKGNGTKDNPYVVKIK